MPVEACSEKPPLSERGDAAGELDHLDAAGDLAHRIGEHLAVLGGEEACEVLTMRVEQRADAEEELGAASNRDRAPLGPGSLGGSDRLCDLVRRSEIDGAGLQAGGRVEDRPAAPRCPVDARSADPVRNPRDPRCPILRGRVCKLRHGSSSSSAGRVARYSSTPGQRCRRDGRALAASAISRSRHVPRRGFSLRPPSLETLVVSRGNRQHDRMAQARTSEDNGRSIMSFRRATGGVRSCWTTRIGAAYLVRFNRVARDCGVDRPRVLLLDTHHHAVVETPDRNLGAGMQLVLGGHSAWFNKQHGRRGAVFRERFWSRRVSREAFLVTCLYVLMNPVAAGLVRHSSRLGVVQLSGIGRVGAVGADRAVCLRSGSALQRDSSKRSIARCGACTSRGRGMRRGRGRPHRAAPQDGEARSAADARSLTAQFSSRGTAATSPGFSLHCRTGRNHAARIARHALSAG